MPGNNITSAAGNRPELSFVIPCYNEEANVRQICAAVAEQVQPLTQSYEIVLIDNGSTDNTRAIIRDICAADARVKAIFNARNFGQMRSPTHAIYQTSGDAVIGLCADFQDPPEMIGELVRMWRGGAEIVLCQRRSEKTSLALSVTRRISYALLSRFADYQAIPEVTGFGLYSRKVVDTLAAWNEPEPFFRGMLVESGFPIALIPYDRPQRARGKTKNSFRTLLDFALSSLTSSAKSMLRLPLMLAPVSGLVAILLCGAAVFSALRGGDVLAWLGFALQFGIFAVLLLFLGLLGVQVRTISDRTRNMPLVVEAERLNFSPDVADASRAA